jgi:hypothetical protein
MEVVIDSLGQSVIHSLNLCQIGKAGPRHRLGRSKGL